MNLLEIIMLILGILIVIISCRIVAHPDKKANDLSIDIKDIYLQEELNNLKEQQTEILNSSSEEAIAKTEDYLSKLSNEKIMAVSEYSDQVLEKITRNHEEVIFLYNMLNNKEKELKETVRLIDSSRQKARETINDMQDETVPEKEEIKPKKTDIQAQNIRRRSKGIAGSEEEDSKQPTISINNTEILKLHSQGKTVMDIARQLGIGQGEVKLVVDLFSDR